jgi:hypothetical protein
MTKKKLAMEAAKLRLKIRMNNRLKLESQALLSRLFREYDVPIADELLGALVFAVPYELKVTANLPGNGADPQKFAGPITPVRPADDDDDDDEHPVSVRPADDDDDDDKGPITPVRPAPDDDDDDDMGPQPVRPADDDDDDFDDKGPISVRPDECDDDEGFDPRPVRPVGSSVKRLGSHKAAGKKHLRKAKTTNKRHK